MADKETSKKKVVFSIHAPDAEKVTVSGSFCNWDLRNQLKRDQQGIFKKTMNLEPGRYEYKFLIDDEWENDPENLNRCLNSFGTENSILIVE